MLLAALCVGVFLSSYWFFTFCLQQINLYISALPQLNISNITFTMNNNNNKQLLLLLLPEFSQSSSSASSVSLWTTTLVTDMSGCCSLASLMAWASACSTGGQPHSGSTEHSRQWKGVGWGGVEEGEGRKMVELNEKLNEKHKEKWQQRWIYH